MAKTLYILGNGFDLAHGLKTSLCCFKCYLEHKDDVSRKFVQALEKYVPVNETWSNFEEALGKLDFEEIKNDAMSYAIPVSDDNFRDNSWDAPRLEAEKEVNFAYEISSYVREWISSVTFDDCSPKSEFDFFNDAIFLSFNYTNTLEKLYGIPNSEITYIHGDCSKKDVLVCGHDNEALLKEMSVRESDFSYYEQELEDVRQGYFRRTWKNPQENIQKHNDFFAKLNSIEKIVILGHSFENSIDDCYFDCIKKLVKQNCKWIISHHTCSDCKNNEQFVRRLGIKNYFSFKM